MPRLTKLKLTRIERERPQIAVALEAHIDPTRLNRIENGWVSPRPAELAAIAAVLGVPVESLETELERAA